MRSILMGAAIAALLLLMACGGNGSSSSNQTTPQPSAAHRVIITVDAVSLGLPSGQTLLLNADTDVPVKAVAVGGTPGFVVISPDKSRTFVADLVSPVVGVINNTTEANAGSISNLADLVTSIVVLPDNKTAYLAVRNAGQVAVVDLSNLTVTSTLSIPTVRTLISSPDGKKLLAFRDDTNTLTVIDTANSNALTAVSGFDRPVFGAFSSDNSKAFVLSCGAECGGASARVTVLDMATNTPGQSVAVSAATVGLLDSSGNLFVAGTQSGVGKLDVVATASMTVSRSGVAISDGFHTHIAAAGNNRIFIGARTCNNRTSGCLSIYNTSAGTAVISAANGDVTGLQPIANRSVVYVIEGGELRIYDSATDALSTTTQINIVGRAVDTKQID